MFKIVLYENNPLLRQAYANFISSYILMENWDAKLVLATDNREKIFSDMTRGQVADLYLLALEHEGKHTGLFIGKELRELGFLGDIAFTMETENVPLTMYAHKISPIDCILKRSIPQMQKRIADCLQISYQKHTQPKRLAKERKAYVKTAEKTFLIENNHILFFERCPVTRKITLHTKEDTYQFIGTLKELEQSDTFFFRCHQSVVVNTQHIIEIDKQNLRLKLTNQKYCHASKRGIKRLANFF